MPEKFTVYNDEQCLFCQWARGVMVRQDRDGQLEFRDFNDPTVLKETPYSLDEHRFQMYVRAPDGKWHAGFWGWVAILSVLPKWKYAGRVLCFPPLSWLGPPLYRFVARHRYRIPDFFLRWLGAPRHCDGTICRISRK